MPKEFANANEQHERIMQLLSGYPDKDVLATAGIDPDMADDTGDGLFNYIYLVAEAAVGDPEQLSKYLHRAIRDLELTVNGVDLILRRET